MKYIKSSSTITKILTCSDCNAPSDKYPTWGYSVDFRDIEHKHYYVEYPRFTARNYDFKDREKYEITFNVKEEHGFLNSVQYKMTRLRNIKKID